jgi:hypothetical protein
MTKREARDKARTTRLRAVRRQHQRSALLRMQFINAVSCRRPLNPDWRPAAES